MSAPDLPDTFGNYLLGEEFVEVVSPAAVSWLPQTTGWVWLGLIVLVFLLRFSWKRLRRWHRDRYRREAIARLAEFTVSDATGIWLIELNKLLKITALAGFSRERVARLSGEEWIDFLNEQCDKPPFTTQQRELLVTGIYRSAAPEEDIRKQLLAASLAWVRTHEAPQRV